METKVQSLVAEIEALSEAERQTLAQEVLPLLLSTRAGLAEIDRSLEALSDAELDTVIERAYQRFLAIHQAVVAHNIKGRHPQTAQRQIADG